MATISHTDSALLLLLRRSLFGSKEAMVLSRDEWRAVIRASYDQAVLPLALDGTEGLPSLSDGELLLAWQQMAVRLQMQNERLFLLQDKILSLLNAGGITAVVLKGSAAAAAYPKPSLRTMGDIDLLVPETQLDACKVLLIQNGFRAEKRGKADDHHIGFLSEDGQKAELHFTLGGIPKEGPAADKLRSILSEATRTAVTKEVDGHVFSAPTPLVHSLVLLVHTASHLSSSGIGIRHLLDWALFVEEELSPDKMSAQKRTSILKTWRQCGLLRFAKLLSLAAAKAFDLPVRPWFDKENEQEAEALLGDFLDGGNLGKIRYQKNFGGGLVTGKGALFAPDAPLAVRMWRNVVISTEKTFPSVKKHRILYVGALPCNLVCQVVRLAKKKQLFTFSKTVKNAKQRLEMIDSLAFFKTTERDIQQKKKPTVAPNCEKSEGAPKEE